MSNVKGYNGWSNYETWSVMLLIDNEQGSQAYWQEVAEDETDDEESDSDEN